MLAYAYNNTEEERVTTYDSQGKTVCETVPRIPDEVQKKLHDKVLEEWPNKDVSAHVCTIWKFYSSIVLLHAYIHAVVIVTSCQLTFISCAFYFINCNFYHCR